MQGLELSERFYRVSVDELFDGMPDVRARHAAGLIGEGSECFGFDDELSQDHDWGPAFCIWLDPAEFEKVGAELHERYARIAARGFAGHSARNDTVQASVARRVGVLEIDAFYGRLLRGRVLPETLDDWRALDEAGLACAVNGRVFEDALGRFTQIRERLAAYYPEDIRLRKIACGCMHAAQAGQYNFIRQSQRGEDVAAFQGLAEFMGAAMQVAYALGVLADQCFGGKPPRTWARIIRRATSSIPVHRYPSVAAFARAIRWRHLWRNAAWLTVALLVLAAMAKLNSGKSHVDDASGARGSMMGNITPEVLEGVMRTGRVPSQKATAEPSIMPNVMRLNGEKEAWPEPVVLEGGKEYRIFGPGTLDADLFCPTTTIVRLKDCVLINRTKRLYPENGIRYRLDNGVYLNFINVKRKPLSLTLGDFLGIYDGAYNQVRFGGPETVKELME